MPLHLFNVALTQEQIQRLLFMIKKYPFEEVADLVSTISEQTKVQVQKLIDAGAELPAAENNNAGGNRTQRRTAAKFNRRQKR